MRVCILFFFLLFFSSCGSDDDRGSQLDCQDNFDWSIEETSEALLGTWTWDYVYYPVSDEYGYYDSEGLEVTFSDDQTAVVTVYDETQTVNWEVVEIPNDVVFEIQTEPQIRQLVGRLIFCGNRMIINDDSVTGLDHHFN